MTRVSVSTVTPVYRGEAYLRDLVAELERVRQTWTEEERPLELLEAIFVDDSAVDGSSAVLAELAAAHPWVTVLTLSRNFGQHPATIAGILHTSGDWVVTLDEDLQHPPNQVLGLLRLAVETSVDVVYAKPKGRVHGLGYRDLSSRLFKRLLVFMTGNAMIEHFNSFRLVRGAVARAAASVCGHETYLDVAFSWFTNRYRHTELELVDERHQATGKSGYSFRTLLAHARRLVVSSQTKLLRFGAMAGAFAVLIAVALEGSVLWQKFWDPAFVDVRGWTSLFSAILFFGGTTSLLLGVVVEYLSSIVLHTQGKPTFFVVDRSQDRRLHEHLQGDALESPAAAPSS
mgnify:CR=1 FL=1